jgi:putative acetyltransferase
MLKLIRTTSDNPDFRHLLTFLDANLAENDGDEHWFFEQFNKLDNIKHVIVAYQNEKPVGCGAIKAYNTSQAEVKRVFVSETGRNKGIASQIMQALEHWAKELGFTECILETGIKQLEAVQLYPKLGYNKIPNYEPYVGVALSVCFGKML